MTSSQKLTFLRDSQSFRIMRELIVNFIGAKLEVFCIEGEVIDFCAGQLELGPSIELNQVLDLNARCRFRSARCLEDIKNSLERMRVTKQPVIVECQSGRKRLFYPVLIAGELTGVIKFVEGENFRLTPLQEKTVINLLQTTIDNFNRNDYSLVRDFAGQDLTHQQKIIQRVIQYINSNYRIPDLSLSEVSRKCGISYHYLSRLFKLELKENFSSYLSRLRMDVGLRLLKDHSLTVSQVATSCGFEDAGYFCKVFKKTYGQSPLSYRKVHTTSVRSRYSRRFRKELV